MKNQLALTLAVTLLAGGAAFAHEQHVALTVTEEGFVPGNANVKKGHPVVLKITRTTDKTCAKEVVIDEYGINQKLPLNEAVTVKFTPSKSGALKYGCGMGKMVGAVLTVE